MADLWDRCTAMKNESPPFSFYFQAEKLEIFGRKECISNIRKERKFIEKSCNTVHCASTRWKVTPLHLWWHPPYNSNDKPTSAVVLTYLFKTRWCVGTLYKSSQLLAMDAVVERLPWWSLKYFLVALCWCTEEYDDTTRSHNNCSCVLQEFGLIYK
jgi:hypothetical protein